MTELAPKSQAMKSSKTDSQRDAFVQAKQALEEMIARQGFVMLDGGFATEMERRGHDLHHPLWSARLALLQEHPQAIVDVHRAYLEAGADCIIAASYQASVPGFRAEGVSQQQAQSLLQKPVQLACQARDQYWQNIAAEAGTRARSLVAASIGPYGAYLADGSEYRGNYGISKTALREFHAPRWHILAQSGADLFACETIPSVQEVEVLLSLMQNKPQLPAWISFSCRDGQHLNDGTPISECAALFRDCDAAVAIGVNCTPPRFIPSLIREIRKSVPEKWVVVYPNSGEHYDALRKVWRGTCDPHDFASAAVEWRALGATLIGGCCRTGPAHIRAMRTALLN